jgi:hypothetical protein
MKTKSVKGTRVNDEQYRAAYERQKLMMQNARPLRNPGDPMPTREDAYERDPRKTNN